MLSFLKKQNTMTKTENGATTYATTNSDCLDLFATIGALRHQPKDDIISRFDRAWCEDELLALKILFYARDIRGGLGERNVFRILLSNLALTYPEVIEKNIWAISEFGRFDDLLCLLDTPAKDMVLKSIKAEFETDMQALKKDDAVSLLGKWLPSINAHNADTIRYGKIIAKSLGLSEAQYRKNLTLLRAKIAIIENNLRTKKYTFDYAKQPSNAMFKYRKAFLRNDGIRYREYLDSVERGEAKMNTNTLLPYEILRPIVSHVRHINKLSPDDMHSIEVSWNAQQDLTQDDNALVVVDGSGSMYTGCNPMPADVAISLGIYFAERNQGAFHNHFITFSERPQLIEVKGRNLVDKVKYVMSYNEVANTNIEKVFRLLLDTAVRNKLSQSDLPSTVYIISDMEFDSCARGAKLTNFESAKKEFARHGYTLPNVVFWNVASRNKQQPVTMNDRGVALVSGTSPRIFSMLTSGALSPYALMMDVIGNERYDKIAI